MPETAFIPVNVITGFLGSGKTTLLQRLLGSPELADTAVLVNEFGEVGLDHHLLRRLDEEIRCRAAACAAPSGAISAPPYVTFTGGASAVKSLRSDGWSSRRQVLLIRCRYFPR